MKHGWIYKTLRTLLVCALLAAVVIFVNKVCVLIMYIPSSSMESTIMTDDILIGNRLFQNIERGDIMIFKYPDNETILYIKRVVGMPGDTVTLKDGKTYINGEVYEEPYLFDNMEMSEEITYEVPEDSYFMMGDNRNNSMDSRFWETKFASKEAMVAKAGFRIWPFDTFGTVNK